MKRKTTSMKIDPKIWKQVKIHCAIEEVELCDYIESLIKKDLKK